MKTTGQPNSVFACKCIASFESALVMPEMPDIWTQQALNSSAHVVPLQVHLGRPCGLSQLLSAPQPPRAAPAWPSCPGSSWGCREQSKHLHQLEPQPAQGSRKTHSSRPQRASEAASDTPLHTLLQIHIGCGAKLQQTRC